MPGTVVDLFAGCGGLSQGLENAGFRSIFVNELHKDALDTYLLNRIDSDVKLPQNNSNDILDITQHPDELDALARRLRREHGDVDLVVGGPPCQGYSGIGHRRSFVLSKEEIPSNHLYREMAKLVQAVAPKAFLFENVKGLLNARWTPGGDKGEIWIDVQAAFRKIRVSVGAAKDLHYEIKWHLVSAKDYGVPQNRPRVLMVGVRSDISIPKPLNTIAGGLLPGPSGAAPDPSDFLGDLVAEPWIQEGRPAHIRTRLEPPSNGTSGRQGMDQGSLARETC